MSNFMLSPEYIVKIILEQRKQRIEENKRDNMNNYEEK